MRARTDDMTAIRRRHDHKEGGVTAESSIVIGDFYRSQNKKQTKCALFYSAQDKKGGRFDVVGSFVDCVEP